MRKTETTDVAPGKNWNADNVEVNAFAFKTNVLHALESLTRRRD
jgi:hypothetical protein